MTKRLVYGVIGMLLCAAVISVAGTRNTFDTAIENGRSESDWSMYGHDPQHTRVADSTAPPNKLLWSYNTTDKVTSSPAIVDDKVYVGSYNNKVYCLDAVTGAEIWNYSTGDMIGSSPAVANEIVYVGSSDGNLYYLNAITGEFIDSFQTDDEITQSPTVVNDKVLIASMDQKLYCLDANSALELWNFSSDIFSLGAPSVIDDKVIYAIWDGSVFCLDIEDGSIIWDHTTTAGIYSSVAIANDKIYFGTINRLFYCLDLIGNGDGTTSEIWNYSVDSMIRSSPAVENGKVLFASKYLFYCLNAQSGEEIWIYDTNQVTLGTSSPAIAEGKVYFCSPDLDLGTIYCLNLSDGDQLWKRFTSNTITASFGIAGGRGYIGSYDGSIYCFGTNEPVLQIENISGGDNVTVLVKNTGLTEATGITINITFSGGLLILPKEYDYPDTIAPEESVEVQMAVIGIGLGIFTPMPLITVTVDCSEGSTDEQSQEAKVFFSQVIISE